MGKQKIKFQCLDCGNIFKLEVEEDSEKDIECPKCKSLKVDLA